MKAILLDFGGTIDTDGVHWSERFRAAYREAGVVVPRREFFAAYARAEAQMCSGMLGAVDGLRKTLQTQVTLQCIELEKGHRTTPSRLLPDPASRIADICLRDVLDTVGRHAPLLRAWSRRYALGLVSNFYGNLTAVTRDLGITEFFGAIVDSAVVGVRKPDPGIFRAALEALRCSPGEAMAVGDSYERDIVPAKSLGCGTAWVRGSVRVSAEDTEKADFVIPSLTDLNSILLERIAHENRT